MKWIGGFLALLLVASSYAAHGENEGENAPSCGTVSTDLASCLSYIKSSNEPNPSAACCNGVKTLAGEAKSKGDRQAICNCVKQALGEIPE
ncbi:Bifunctional inhibitor/plant lipid transfer protein/seed storage helical domain [Dillenia turbinata]|uniref:Bifunctional inhibitor/plant lipid transfer protein/seed storage helical domain n=1 Tax=Dillenia turbinata TaxID=194707 RepID=A0AAN8UWQ8_9MAGN